MGRKAAPSADVRVAAMTIYQDDHDHDDYDDDKDGEEITM